MSTPIHASLTAPGDKTVTTVEAPVPILNILVHDVRSGLPIQNSPVKRLVINKEEYIANKVISEAFFNRCRKHVDVIGAEPLNLIRKGNAATQMQVKLSLQKLMQTSIFKLKYKFFQQTRNDFSLIDNDLKFDTSATETEVINLLNRSDYQYCTSKEGRLYIPIPNDLFKQKLTIEVGFERFAIVAETFDASGESLLWPKDKASDLRVVWDDSITTSPNFETDFFKSWGWKLEGSKKNFASTGKGNKAVDGSIASYFKTTEKFEVQACTINANLANFDPDSSAVEKKQKEDYLKWLETNFNPRLLSGKRFFNLQDHFILHGLQFSQPTWYSLSESDLKQRWLISGDHTSIYSPMKVSASYYNGLLLPTKLHNSNPEGYTQAGRDYGTYVPTKENPTPRYDGGRKIHEGIDYYGDAGVSKVFAVGYAKSLKHTSFAGHGHNVKQKFDLPKTGFSTVIYAHLQVGSILNRITNSYSVFLRPGEIIGLQGITFNGDATHNNPPHCHLEFNINSETGTSSPPWAIVSTILDREHRTDNDILPNNDGLRLLPCDCVNPGQNPQACSIKTHNTNGPISNSCWAFLNNLCKYYDPPV